MVRLLGGIVLLLAAACAPARDREAPPRFEIRGDGTAAPLLTEKDLVRYDWDSHRLRLVPPAYQRLRERWRGLGPTFHVVVDGAVAYSGEIRMGLESDTSEAPALLPIFEPGLDSIEILQCYPSPGWCYRESVRESLARGAASVGDPRSNPRVKAALRELGKLAE